ncbi:BON domain-containing protein [Acidovorax sp. CCYZU-2555]|uniref:BON domain-containing protein n=1 Tax=Acidovorax sp. CCYZU-2555 TaxID=2835042 RepID=UPI001BCF628C|nr:BON domain-containing protein [Acidovorax sp. CCYZU-2555]MBS7778600.1 BON domain-containing protein [Acidovorax sp. CCYZU-2555]
MKFKIRRAVCSSLAVVLLGGAMSACVPLVVGGGMVAGTLVAVDRRTAGTQVEDESIEVKAASRIRETLGDKARINVTSYNRQVLLTGEVGNETDKQTLGRLVESVDNVRAVVNEAVVAPFTATLSQRSGDTFITGKVRASLMDAKDIQASAIKVTTENKVVYLMGIVTPREAKRAAEIARGVNDVVKVVRVFEVVSEDDLARYQPKQAPVTTDSSPTVAP